MIGLFARVQCCGVHKTFLNSLDLNRISGDLNVAVLESGHLKYYYYLYSDPLYFGISTVLVNY